MKKYHLFLLWGFLTFMACSPSRQAQHPTEVRYVPPTSTTDELTVTERQTIDELIQRKLELQAEIDRLTLATDTGNEADAGQLEGLNKQMTLLDTEIGSYLSTPSRRSYYQQQWKLRNQ